uniref:Predicted protein n=1 Tax=Physcomitrium patens TaxID=3218 RepID=A9U2P8_PHYPA
MQKMIRNESSVVFFEIMRGIGGHTESQNIPPTLDNAISSAEIYETAYYKKESHGREKKCSKKKKRRSNSSSSSSASSDSSSSSSSSSKEDTRKASYKRKEKRKKDRKKEETTPRPSTPKKEDPMDTLRKKMAELKIQVVGTQPSRPKPSYQRPNIWCTICQKPGHTASECYSNRPSYPVQQMEWVPAWDYYEGYQQEDQVYVGEEVPTHTPIPPVMIPRYVPREYVQNLPHRTMVPHNSPPVANYDQRPAQQKHAVRFSTAPPVTISKVDTPVNLVSWDHTKPSKDLEMEWPEEFRDDLPIEVLKVETRYTKKQKKKGTSSSSSESPPPKKKSERKNIEISTPSKKETPKQATASPHEDKQPTAFPADIREEVQELIHKEVQDELAPVVPEKKVEVPSTKTIQKKQVVPNYDVVEDLKGQKANVTFEQLLADSKPYKKLVASSLRHTNATRKRILPTVFHVEQEDLGSPEIDVEIAGCILKEVPDLRGPAQKQIIVSWKKVPHLGETPPIDQGYTSETSETSSTDLKDPYDVSYLTCYLVDEDEEDSRNEDPESEKNLDLARLGISSTSHVTKTVIRKWQQIHEDPFPEEYYQDYLRDGEGTFDPRKNETLEGERAEEDSGHSRRQKLYSEGSRTCTISESRRCE